MANTTLHKAKKQPQPEGICTGTISACAIHTRYLCPLCHKINGGEYLIKAPRYATNTLKQCTWTGRKKAITSIQKGIMDQNLIIISYGRRRNQRM